jgi:hypothetical protein
MLHTAKRGKESKFYPTRFDYPSPPRNVKARKDKSVEAAMVE